MIKAAKETLQEGLAVVAKALADSLRVLTPLAQSVGKVFKSTTSFSGVSPGTRATGEDYGDAVKRLEGAEDTIQKLRQKAPAPQNSTAPQHRN